MSAVHPASLPSQRTSGAKQQNGIENIIRERSSFLCMITFALDVYVVNHPIFAFSIYYEKKHFEFKEIV